MSLVDDLTIPVLYSVEAEESLCGGVLIRASEDGQIPEELKKYNLKPKDFFIIRNQWVWDAMLELDVQKKLDILTVWDMLWVKHSKKDCREFGGPARLTTLLVRCDNSYDIERDAELIKELSERRFALRIANRLAQVIYTLNEPFDLNNIIAKLYTSRIKLE